MGLKSKIFTQAFGKRDNVISYRALMHFLSSSKMATQKLLSPLLKRISNIFISMTLSKKLVSCMLLLKTNWK